MRLPLTRTVPFPSDVLGLPSLQFTTAVVVAFYNHAPNLTSNSASVFCSLGTNSGPAKLLYPAQFKEDLGLNGNPIRQLPGNPRVKSTSTSSTRVPDRRSGGEATRSAEPTRTDFGQTLAPGNYRIRLASGATSSVQASRTVAHASSWLTGG